MQTNDIVGLVMTALVRYSLVKLDNSAFKALTTQQRFFGWNAETECPTLVNSCCVPGSCSAIEFKHLE